MSEIKQKSSLYQSQKELIDELNVILADGPLNTHQIAQARCDVSAYESNLRDRMFRLAKKGYLDVKEILSPTAGYYFVKERLWKLPEQPSFKEG